MSATIDEKVVEMRFNNHDFENNVKTSLSTLEKLRQGLKLDGIANGFDNIGSAVGGINFNPLSGAIETVHAKFSALEIIGITALQNITNSAINTGKQLVKSLSIDQITAGFTKFGSKTSSVATLVAQGYALEEVNDQLDRLNWFTDETSYNFTDMVSNIAKFTASGKGLTESVTAMEGIANWAALSGQNAQTASNAMYQLSQAMSAGVMRKEDYKSIQNASMDTQEFRQKCIDAAIALGTLKDNGNGTFKSLVANVKDGDFTINQFADHLTQDAWLTSDVMMKVFNDYSSAVAGIYQITEDTGKTASQIISEIDKTVKKEGISVEDAIRKLGYVAGDGSLLFDEFGLKALKAAQQARTWGDAVDSVKDAVSTGWMNTFEIIFGNSEEATELWTDLANAMWDLFASGGEARNEMLKQWKEWGGRNVLLEGFWNTWETFFGDGDEYIGILGSIKEAFRDVFPAMTADRLLLITIHFKQFTEKLKPSEEQLQKLKAAFRGFFSVLDIGMSFIKSVGKGVIDLIKNFSGITTNILDYAAALGDWLSVQRDSIKETNIFGKAVDSIIGIIKNVTTNIKEFVNSIEFKFDLSGLESFKNILDTVWSTIKKIGSKIGEVLTSIGTGIGEFLAAGDMATLMKLFNEGLIAGLILKLGGFIKTGKDFLGDTKDFIGSIKEMLSSTSEKKNSGGLLDALKDSLSKMQEAIDSNKIIKIAAAVGILAVALKTISTIDSNKIGEALVAMAGAFAELLGSMKILEGIDTGSVSTSGVLVLSISMTIMASALKKMGDLDWGQVGRGLTAMGGVMLELIGFTKLMKNSSVDVGSMAGFILLATSLKIFASALGDFASYNWEQIKRGLAGMGGVLIELSLFSKILKNANIGISSGVGFVLLAASMKIFASAMGDFANFNWNQIGRGLTAMGGALLELAVAMRIMPKNTIGIGLGMVAVGAALHIIASAFQNFGSMEWDEIGKGLTGMGLALLELSIAMGLMSKSIGGAAAMLIASVALMALSVPIILLSKIKWTSLIKSLIALAGALVVIGVGGAALGAAAGLIILGSVALAGMSAAIMLLVPALAAMSALSWGTVLGSIAKLVVTFATLGVAAAVLGIVSPLILAFGAALISLGAGIALIGVGLSMISGALQIFVESIVNSAATISSNMSTIVDTIVALLSSLVDGAIELVPKIVELGITIITSLLTSIEENLPKIIESGANIVIEFLNGISTKLPEIIQAGFDLVLSFVNGIADSMEKRGPEIGEALSRVFIAAINTLLSYLTGGALKDIKTAATKLMNSGFIKGLKSKVSEISKTFVDGIKNAKTAIAKKYEEIKSAAVTLITNFINGIKSKVSEVETTFSNAVTNAKTAISNKVGEFLSTGITLISNFINGIKNKASEVATTFTNAVTNAKTAISNKVGEFLSAGHSLISNLISGIVAKAYEVATTFTNAINNAKTAISNKVGELFSSGRSLISNFVSGIYDKASGVMDAFTNAVENAKSVISDKVSEWLSIGKNLIGGLISGIKEKATALVDAAKGVVDDAIQAAKNLLQINSPSKVFRSMGYSIDEGLVVGIGGHAKSVVAATTKLGNSAINAMSNVVSHMSDTINTNLDSQPTIRPILDLTNVETGAGKINSMLSRAQAMSISASMNSRYDPDNQNGFGSVNTTYQFTQNNYSPKALSRIDIYRQTKNQFESLKGMVKA